MLLWLPPDAVSSERLSYVMDKRQISIQMLMLQTNMTIRHVWLYLLKTIIYLAFKNHILEGKRSMSVLERQKEQKEWVEAEIIQSESETLPTDMQNLLLS